MKRTFTMITSALILLFVAAILAFPKLQEPTKPISKKATPSLIVRTTKKTVRPTEEKEEPVTLRFRINASFEPEPTEESENEK